METVYVIIIGIAALVVGIVSGIAIGIQIRKAKAEKEIGSAEEEAKRIVANAKAEGESQKKAIIV